MSSRQTRTEAQPQSNVIFFDELCGPDQADWDAANERIAALRMAVGVGRDLAAHYENEPGRFPYTPDPVTAELVQGAFRQGMALGRRLEAQDSGVHVKQDSSLSLRVLWGGADDGAHDDVDTEQDREGLPLHGQTGLYVLAVMSVVALAVVCARIFGAVYA